MDAANGALVFISCVHSLIMIAALGLTDPKSGRTASLALDQMMVSRLRRLTLALALLPGAVMLFAGLAVAFLAWFGFVTLAGWGVAIALASWRRSDRDESKASWTKQSMA